MRKGFEKGGIICDLCERIFPIGEALRIKFWRKEKGGNTSNHIFINHACVLEALQYAQRQNLNIELAKASQHNIV